MVRNLNLRPLGVAVAGLGHVGRATARLLWTRRADYAAAGTPVRLVAVCDRQAGIEARRLGLPKSIKRTRTAATLVNDPAVDVVVELFGGLGDARRLVLDSLAAGKHVVTGNKLLLSKCWKQVFAASRRRRRRLRFEAAVAGGIPIISAVRSGLAADRISSVYGIFNGTTNYILSRMAHEGCEMATALKEAQRLGMAEKDPALDLNGSDTMYKVSILASLLTGTWVPPARVQRQGIERLEAEDIRFAVTRLRRTPRLLGTIGIRWGTRPLRVEAHVQPSLIPLDHPLAAVHGGYNAVLVEASSAKDLMFYGKGAGPGPAASAAVADILALSREVSSGAGTAAPADTRRDIAHIPECAAPFYLKLRVRDVPGALSKIAGHLGKADISIAEIHQNAPGAGRAVSVMILTHATSRAAVDRARRAITALPMVSPKHSTLRLLG